MRLSEFEGQFFEVVRDAEFETMGILVSDPKRPYLCFAEADNFLKSACAKEDITCIIVTEALADNEVLVESGKGIAVCKSPRTAFYEMHNWLADNKEGYANSYEETTIGEGCIIHPSASIPSHGVKIGNNVLIEEFVVIRPGSVIGDNVVLRAGVVIGGSNYSVCHHADGKLFLVKQIGNVEIGNDVEISYHAVIGCGMFPYNVTTVKSYSCIDTGALIAHNSTIGHNTMVMAQSQVSGSTVIGNGVRISPQAIVSNCLEVGDDVTVTIGSTVVNNVKKGQKVSGNFAIEHSKFLAWHRKKLR
ncbi:MAG: hypothetical protein IJW18_04720 [Lachnospiraceae bacterium]|nr:hypothetical protein [Lachnospiraceae bacterium]